MKQFFVQYIKEFKGYFGNFSAYAIFGAYYILSMFAALYFGDYFLRESEIMNAYFIMQPIILTLVIPAITMRLWADEAKSGTLELLLSLPISYLKLTLAKFFAAFCFFILLISSSLVLLFVSDALSFVDKGAVFSAYAGLVLCGALFTSAGCLFSALSRNSILSYIATIFALFAISQLEFTTLHIGNFDISLRGLNFEDNYKAFLSGFINIRSFIYFILGIALFLWATTAVFAYRKASKLLEKHHFKIFLLLLVAIFICFVLGSDFAFNKMFDITETQKFSLSQESKDFLEKSDKRLNVTLYEAKSKREEANSSYAIYAETVEQMFAAIFRESDGAVRIETVLTEPFSELERQLLRKHNISFKEDNLGQKAFMAAEFSDNEGHSATINAFPDLRQNMLETDIMRIIRNFGKEKQPIALIAAEQDLKRMQSFSNMLNEFYEVSRLDKTVSYIVPTYKTVILINPIELDSSFLLALEQYVLGGGSLVIFSDPEFVSQNRADPLKSFLDLFGFIPEPQKNIMHTTGDINTGIGAAYMADTEIGKGIRSVLYNGAGTLELKPGKTYSIRPLLTADKKIIAAASVGEFFSDFIEMAYESEQITPSSTASGKVFFIYDSNILDDLIYVSEDSQSYAFYDTVATADNFIFLVRLIDQAAGGGLETGLSYKPFNRHRESIGNILLHYIQEHYQSELDTLNKKLADYQQRKQHFYDTLKDRGFASVKNIGDISGIEQICDETENKIHQIKAAIANDYQTLTAIFTLVIILGIPFVLIIVLLLLVKASQYLAHKKLRRLIRNAETS